MIRIAKIEDLPQINAVFTVAREFMTANGNPHQWLSGYPSEELLMQDIDKGQLYVEEANGIIHAVFVLALGEDPTYAYIEDGNWFSDTSYGTIHRLASDGVLSGFFGRCLTFCKSQISHIRLDTHRDNKIVQHLAEKYGFQRCGTIYLADGSPRIAFEWIG